MGDRRRADRLHHPPQLAQTEGLAYGIHSFAVESGKYLHTFQSHALNQCVCHPVGHYVLPDAPFCYSHVYSLLFLETHQRGGAK